MIASKYNIWLDNEEGSGKLCFSCKTGGFAELDDQSYDLFQRVISDDFDESKLDDKEKQIFLEFKKGHLIAESEQIDADVSADEFQYKMNTSNQQMKGLTILPTLDCNCKCDYCYQGEKQKISMDDEVADCLKKEVDIGIANNMKALQVMWFGGEPLLEFDRIEELSTYFIKKTSESKVSYNADIISNCVLLTKERAKKLKELKVRSIQCTLDGSRKKHNRTRILHDDSPTFDIIIKNVIEASEFLPISIRLNIDKEVIEEGMDQFLKDISPLKGRKNIGFYPAMVSADNTSACMSVESKCYDNVVEFSKVYVEVYKALLENGYPMNWRIRPRIGGCGATNYTAKVVQPDGNVCRCWSQVGAEGESYGNIKNMVETFDRNNYYKWMLYNPYSDEECNECKFFPICRRGCPANHVPESTDFMKPASDRGKMCTMSKYNIKEMLRLSYDSYKKQMEQKAMMEKKEKKKVSV